MIARNAHKEQHHDVWARLAAPLPAGLISWRQDGRPAPRDGKYFARYVAYVDANTVRDRLDTVVPGEWNLTLDLLPSLVREESESFSTEGAIAFKARLQILGVVREDVGTGRDYKSASTDAFKRAAVRFGIAHELYALGQNWVQMDGDGRYAKPLEEPHAAYERRHAREAAMSSTAANGSVAGATVEAGAGGTLGATTSDAVPTPAPSRTAVLADVPSCPKCGGRMWDNRVGKRNPKAPDFKCRDRSCDGVIWPPKTAARSAASAEAAPADRTREAASASAADDDIPF